MERGEFLLDVTACPDEHHAENALQRGNSSTIAMLIETGDSAVVLYVHVLRGV